MLTSKQLLPVDHVTKLGVTLTATATSGYNHPGVVFNFKDVNNYEMVYVRLWTAVLNNGLSVQYATVKNGVFAFGASVVAPGTSRENRVLKIIFSSTQREIFIDSDSSLFTVSGNFANDVPCIGLFSWVKTSHDSTTFTHFTYTGKTSQRFGTWADFRFYNHSLTDLQIQNQQPKCEHQCARGQYQKQDSCLLCPPGRYGNTTGLHANLFYSKHTNGCAGRNEICNRYESPCTTAASRLEVSVIFKCCFLEKVVFRN
jgi:hypothetical protein